MAQYPTSRTHVWSPLTCRRASHYICESFVNKRGKKKKAEKTGLNDVERQEKSMRKGNLNHNGIFIRTA